MRRHLADPFVNQAQQQGYRSRSAYKLKEIDAKGHLFRSGMVVVDLGAAPGGWSQVAVEAVGRRGKVIAVDILSMEPISNVDIVQGDFCERDGFEAVLSCVGNQSVDLVISDMAPNITGTRSVDQPKAMYLAELALDFASRVLEPGGDLVVKVFQGEGCDTFRRDMQQVFAKVLTRKPKASRPQSRELYLQGKNRIVQ